MIDLSYKLLQGVYALNSTLSSSAEFNFWENKMPVWGWVLAGIDAFFYCYFLYNYKKEKNREIERAKKEGELERDLLK